MRETTTGTLFGLGVGPGDPELLTVKAARILAQVAVVAYPQASEGDAMARSIAARFIPESVEELSFAIPMRTDRAPARAAYDAAAKAIAARLDRGQDVAVLCEGDPFFYGSFMYIYERLHGTYRIEVVAGVTSLTAAAAALGRPLAARNDVLAVIPAPVDVARLRTEIAAADAIAIVKVGRHFAKVRAVLDELQLIDRAVLVCNASGEAQTVTPLNRLAEEDQPYFSIILVYKGAESW